MMKLVVFISVSNARVFLSCRLQSSPSLAGKSNRFAVLTLVRACETRRNTDAHVAAVL
jgi:hypothetical protein